MVQIQIDIKNEKLDQEVGIFAVKNKLTKAEAVVEMLRMYMEDNK